VGPYEQLLYPALLGTLAGAAQKFEQVYAAGGVHIFLVLNSTRTEFVTLPQG